jgi:hypothetical protein
LNSRMFAAAELTSGMEPFAEDAKCGADAVTWGELNCRRISPWGILQARLHFGPKKPL